MRMAASKRVKLVNFSRVKVLFELNTAVNETPMADSTAEGVYSELDHSLSKVELESEAKELNLNQLKQVNPNTTHLTLEPQASVRRCALICR